MGVAGSVIFPFYESSSYFQGYSWALELATRLHARFRIFTTLPLENINDTGPTYQSLLAAHGYFLHQYRHENNHHSQVQKETTIARGSMMEKLPVFLKDNPQGILVLDAAFRSGMQNQFNSIVRDSDSAIILPETQAGQHESITVFFFDQLQQAEFYKVPKTFFDGLGQDKSVFNYLRSFFQKTTSHDNRKTSSG